MKTHSSHFSGYRAAAETSLAPIVGRAGPLRWWPTPTGGERAARLRRWPLSQTDRSVWRVAITVMFAKHLMNCLSNDLSSVRGFRLRRGDRTKPNNPVLCSRNQARGIADRKKQQHRDGNHDP